MFRWLSPEKQLTLSILYTYKRRSSRILQGIAIKWRDWCDKCNLFTCQFNQDSKLDIFKTISIANSFDWFFCDFFPSWSNGGFLVCIHWRLVSGSYEKINVESMIFVSKSSSFVSRSMMSAQMFLLIFWVHFFWRTVMLFNSSG